MTPPHDPLTFRCRPSLGVFILGVLFFGLGVALFGWKAWTNDRGLILSGLIHFTPFAASIFYGVLAACSAAFVVVALWAILVILTGRIPDVVLSRDAISFPVGFPVKRPFAVPLTGIRALSRSSINGQDFLTLHTDAKKHYIALNWLESKEAAQTLEAELARRLA